ncbi:MAG: hypothetical protein AAF604_20860 [Acidobacteriota bacterium]
MTDSPKAAIEAFIANPAKGDFDILAQAAFAFQYERLAPYRRLCDERGARPGELPSWRQVPAIPASAFRSLELATAEPQAVFRSSGTTGGSEGEERSVHHHPYPDLYRRAIDAAFPAFCLPTRERPVMLSLVPDLEDSSLAFMARHVLEHHGTEGSVSAFGPKRLNLKVARSWLGARQRDRRPAFLFATTFALAHLTEALEKQNLRFRLPVGSTVLETGGFKGRAREVSRQELHQQLEAFLGIPRGRIVGEYGMTELTSQLYTGTLQGGDPDAFGAPHWVRWRLLDPISLEEVPAGETGLITLFDLANLGSAVHLMTEDLGTDDGDGLRLVGRAQGAELRGCSLTVEELLG